MDDRVANWKTADRSSAGLLPPVGPDLGAVVRIFSARTVRWRGIVATHSWIVVKEAGATAYSRFDYTAWGKPIWIDRFVPDGRWFGRTPEVVFAADGPAAERMIPRIREAVRNFPYPNIGDYRAWPGPNSNTFVTAIMGAVGRERSTPHSFGQSAAEDGRAPTCLAREECRRSRQGKEVGDRRCGQAIEAKPSSGQISSPQRGAWAVIEH